MDFLIPIKIEKYPVVIVTDSHCHIKLLRDLKGLYPFSQFICLGDITDLFSEKDAFNKHSIEYFIENKIPCLMGNHESFIKACYSGDGFELSNVLINTSNPPVFRIDEKIHVAYLKTLPLGFKLELPDGNHYLCFHHAPRNLWGFNEKNTLNDEDMHKLYPIEKNTIAILHGHLHKAFVEEHKDIKRYSIGALKFKEYAILDENGIHFKTL